MRMHVHMYICMCIYIYTCRCRGFRLSFLVYRVYNIGSNNSEGLGLRVAPLKGFPHTAQTLVLCEPINPKLSGS